MLLETDLGVEANMAYYQVPGLLLPGHQAGDMPFNFGLARNLGPNLTAGEVKEEVGEWGEGVARWSPGWRGCPRVARLTG